MKMTNEVGLFRVIEHGNLQYLMAVKSHPLFLQSLNSTRGTIYSFPPLSFPIYILPVRLTFSRYIKMDAITRGSPRRGS
jgi:hypothetical protein